ncbi:hypothetical protein AJ80_09488 [Polytolypa hystricis UAMH7299]|uniref:Rhodopsin domain-containing protein n=1 Tax=Polytolypa hystricis (strain UAMH7299) TaxID=1447883 RepID=A0A2B7WPL3_POLH7|nr:hypothetical protein AJ80_09488 [Polytolypa hystricis UAMH7299]
MERRDDSLQPWTIAVTASVTVMAFVSVCLRLLSRYERNQRLWWDDWMIIFSMAWNLVVVGFIFAMVHYGMGLHALDPVPMEDIVTVAKLLLVAEILYVFNLVWTKISFLMMFYRIFHFPYFKRWAYIIGGFVVAWVICITFLFVFICVPVQKMWYPDLPGRCIDQVGTWIANAVSTIVTDLAILILPIPQVWKLQLSRSEKFALTIAFGLGFFVVFASTYRFTVLFSYDANDPTYSLAPTVGWTAIEMAAGITSACLPTMRPALQLIVRSLGIQHLMPSFIRAKISSQPGGTSASHGGNRSTGIDPAIDASNGRDDYHKRSTSQHHTFYPLSDDACSDLTIAQKQKDHDAEAGAAPSSGKMRPDDGYIFTSVTSTRNNNSGGDGDSLSSDEVPLHSIRVQKDFSRIDNVRKD